MRRDTLVIIGRVIWTKADRFGVRAQDRVAAASLLAHGSSARNATSDSGLAGPERRARPRPAQLEWRHARSREKGLTPQFACIAGFGFVLAACAYEAGSTTLSDPLAKVSARLGETP